MQAVRHIARIIAYLDPIGHRTSDSAYSLQMHACTCLPLKSFPVRPIAWILLERLVVSLLQSAIEGSGIRSNNCAVHNIPRLLQDLTSY